MKKAKIIIGVIIFIVGPLYLYFTNKLDVDLLMKLIIDAGIFIILVYNIVTNNFNKNKEYFINTFINFTIILIFIVSGYSILQSIILDRNFIMEYIPFLKNTNSFLFFLLLYYTITSKINKLRHENIKEVD